MQPPDICPHETVANWHRDPRLRAFKDDFGRSMRRHSVAGSDAVPELAGIAENLKLLRELRATSETFFEAHDYAWAFRRDSYFDPGANDQDAANQSLRHQLTVLRTLVGVWEVVRGMRPQPRVDLNSICARYVVSSDLSPTCRLSGGFGYLMVPFGFRRLTRELLQALCSRGPGNPPDAPSVFAGLSKPLPSSAFKGFALPFVARRLGLARSHDMANQHGAEEFLLAEVPAFSGARIDFGEGAQGGLAAGLHELLMAFSVNHELGHLIYRHGGRNHPQDEGIADTTSLDVSLSDWGWLASFGASTGLPDPVWFLLGPSLFFWVVDIILRLDVLVQNRQPAEAAMRFQIMRERRARVEERIRWLVRRVWPAFGVTAPLDALDAVAGFRGNLEAAAASFDRSPELTEAVRAGKERLGPFLELH